MALQLPLTAEQTSVGIDVPAAYARIVAIQFDAKTGVVRVAVDVHASQAARQAEKAPVSGGVFEGKTGTDMPDLDDSIPGIRAALYGWLKTLPLFSTAIDA